MLTVLLKYVEHHIPSGRHIFAREARQIKVGSKADQTDLESFGISCS